VRILLFLLSFLMILDGVLTNILVTRNLAYEINPILANVAGRPGLLIIKLLGAILAAIILWRMYQRYRALAIAITTFFVLVYGSLVMWSSLWLA
jgi:hypothetical protein